MVTLDEMSPIAELPSVPAVDQKEAPVDAYLAPRVTLRKSDSSSEVDEREASTIENSHEDEDDMRDEESTTSSNRSILGKLKKTLSLSSSMTGGDVSIPPSASIPTVGSKLTADGSIASKRSTSSKRSILGKLEKTISSSSVAGGEKAISRTGSTMTADSFSGVNEREASTIENSHEDEDDMRDNESTTSSNRSILGKLKKTLSLSSSMTGGDVSIPPSASIPTVGSTLTADGSITSKRSTSSKRSILGKLKKTISSSSVAGGEKAISRTGSTLTADSAANSKRSKYSSSSKRSVISKKIKDKVKLYRISSTSSQKMQCAPSSEDLPSTHGGVLADKLSATGCTLTSPTEADVEHVDAPEENSTLAESPSIASESMLTNSFSAVLTAFSSTDEPVKSGEEDVQNADLVEDEEEEEKEEEGEKEHDDSNIILIENAHTDMGASQVEQQHRREITCTPIPSSVASQEDVASAPSKHMTFNESFEEPTLASDLVGFLLCDY